MRMPADAPAMPIIVGPPMSMAELTDLARSFGREMVEAARSIALNAAAKDVDRMRAIDTVLAWGYGKPLGIGAGARAPAEAKEPKLGKKAALEHAAKNPDPESPMGSIMAARAARRNQAH